MFVSQRSESVEHEFKDIPPQSKNPIPITSDELKADIDGLPSVINDGVFSLIGEAIDEVVKLMDLEKNKQGE